VFIRKPASRQPVLRWEREPPGSFAPWREVQPGTDEYQLEMFMVMRVLQVHRAARMSETP